MLIEFERNYHDPLYFQNKFTGNTEIWKVWIEQFFLSEKDELKIEISKLLHEKGKSVIINL
jgi:hypothetical protein